MRLAQPLIFCVDKLNLSHFYLGSFHPFLFTNENLLADNDAEIDPTNSFHASV